MKAGRDGAREGPVADNGMPLGNGYKQDACQAETILHYRPFHGEIAKGH